MSSLIFFLPASVIAISWLRRNADPLSPGKLFLFVWSITLGTTELKLSALQHTWSPIGWAVLSLGIGSFLAGTFVVYVIHLDAHLLSLDMIRKRVRDRQLDERRAFKGIVLLFLCYAVSYLIIYQVKGFLPISSLQDAMRRTEFQLFFFGIFLHMVVPILFFSVAYYFLVRASAAHKTVVIIIAVMAFLSYALLLSRYQLIMALVVSGVLLYYATTAIRWWKVLSVFGLALFVSLAILTHRSGELVHLFLWKTSKMTVPASLAFVTEPYMYVSMNLENFVRGVERIEYFTGGLLTSDFLLALVGLKHALRSYFGIESLPYLISGYNTYTSFWTYYRDFGLPGLVIIEFLLGSLAAILYYRLRLDPSIGRITAYAFAVFVIMFSFFINILSNLWFVAIGVGTYILIRVSLNPASVEQ
ncbi:MAG TPA: O-antigen polymerase [Nitrososphaera sp.]|nr:O-antigen polymerase [Nitrososphaera sp.]